MSFGNISDDANLDFEPIPEKIFLKGVSFDGRQDTITKLKAGMPITLVRDPFNQYDRFAIKAFVNFGGNDVHIGWIPKEIATILSPELDANIMWDAKIEEITNTFEKLHGVAVKLNCVSKII